MLYPNCFNEPHADTPYRASAAYFSKKELQPQFSVSH
jgi:hypothetical protein